VDPGTPVDEILPLIDLGGTLAFASVVWWEVRGLRNELGTMLTQLVERLSVLEERTRAHTE